MKQLSIFLLLFLAFSSEKTSLMAQNITISGYITDESGEGIPSASVFDSVSKRGVLTNNYGFFSLSWEKNNALKTVNMRFSSVGFEMQDTTFTLLESVSLKRQLKTQTLAAVEIKEKRFQNTNKIGVVNLPLAQIRKVPSIGGEVDIIKALGLTPGVSNGTEGSAGLFVRGGTPDQNLILLDEAVVYNPTHLFGLLSVFNPDAIKNVELTKGGFPARYGGRLSSVLDISMREGSLEKKKTDFSIGLITSRIHLERPIIKNKLSVMLSARSAYLDLLLFPINLITNDRAGYKETFTYRMYDVNAKLHYKINEKNSLFLSFYNGRDRLLSLDENPAIRENADFGWGNSTLSLRHNSLISPKLFWRNMLTYSRFQLRAQNENRVKSFDYQSTYKNISGLEDVSLKSAIDYYPHSKHQIKAGIEHIFHFFNPQTRLFTSNDTSLANLDDRQFVNATETAAFIEDEWTILRGLRFNAGFRFNVYQVGKKTYTSPEPRLSLAYDIAENLTIKASYSQMQQNIHLLVNANTGFQADFWVPSTEGVRPQRSAQVSLGIFKFFPKYDLEASIEIYQKNMTDLIDVKDGTNLITDVNSWEKAVEVSGTGQSKGIEFFLQKKSGRLNGFLSYTLAETTREFANINNGKTYPFRYDNRHNFALTFNYQLSKKWDFSGTFVLKTGEAISLATYNAAGPPNEGTFVRPPFLLYTERNNFRLPLYHRADVGFNRTTFTQKGRRKTWSFSVFNVYNRQNYSYVQIVNEPQYADNKITGYVPKLKGKTLFPIIPSFSFSKSF